MYQTFEENKNYLNDRLHVSECFDIVNREFIIGGKNAVFLFCGRLL